MEKFEAEIKVRKFNIFKKSRTLTEQDLLFLTVIVNQLPSRYEYLIQQINDEFLLEKHLNTLGDEGAYTLTLNVNLEKK